MIGIVAQTVNRVDRFALPNKFAAMFAKYPPPMLELPPPFDPPPPPPGMPPPPPPKNGLDPLPIDRRPDPKPPEPKLEKLNACVCAGSAVTAKPATVAAKIIFRMASLPGAELMLDVTMLLRRPQGGMGLYVLQLWIEPSRTTNSPTASQGVQPWLRWQRWALRIRVLRPSFKKRSNSRELRDAGTAALDVQVFFGRH